MGVMERAYDWLNEFVIKRDLESDSGIDPCFLVR